MRPGICDALGVNLYHGISATSAQELWDRSRGSLFSSHWSLGCLCDRVRLSWEYEHL